MTENIGSTTTVNNDAHVRVWVAQIPAAATYNITTDGQVNGFIEPRLAFGHSSSYGFLVWVFVAMFVAGLVDSILSGWWLSRTRRKAAAAVVQGSVPEWPSLSAPEEPAVRETHRRGRPAGATQNAGGAAGFRRVDRGGVSDREASDPRRALSFSGKRWGQCPRATHSS